MIGMNFQMWTIPLIINRNRAESLNSSDLWSIIPAWRRHCQYLFPVCTLCTLTYHEDYDWGYDNQCPCYLLCVHWGWHDGETDNSHQVEPPQAGSHEGDDKCPHPPVQASIHPFIHSWKFLHHKKANLFSFWFFYILLNCRQEQTCSWKYNFILNYRQDQSCPLKYYILLNCRLHQSY